jgi:glycosyltransferase involved in cell wall biosynthesis
MIKIYTQGWNPDKIGGGWTFLSNFRKIFAENLVDTPEECDIYFITSVSQLNKLSEVPKDKKVVLRVDNILKRSCNGDIYPFEGDEKVTRMEAMRLVAQRADVVIYQSKWSKELLHHYLRPKHYKIIMNAADESIFYPQPELRPEGKKIYFYSRSSNHDNKGFHKIYYEFQKIFKEDNLTELWITGRFSPENIPRNFDFFNGETVKYFGHIQDPEAMAFYMKSSDVFLYSYAEDCCSNTLIEAYLSGIDVKYLDFSGGAKEICNKFWDEGREYFYLSRMENEYWEVFEKLMKKKS